MSKIIHLKAKLLTFLEGDEFDPTRFRDKELLVYEWRNSWFGVANMAMFVGLDLYMFYVFMDASPKTLERIQSDKGLLFIGLLFSCLQLLGIYHLYNVLVGKINKTQFRLHEGYLLARRGPLPWINGCTKVRTSEIRAIRIQTYKMLGIRNRIKYYKVVLETDKGSKVLESRIPHEGDAAHLKSWVDKQINPET